MLKSIFKRELYQSRHFNNVYYSPKELSLEMNNIIRPIANDTKQSCLLSLSQESSTSSTDSNFS